MNKNNSTDASQWTVVLKQGFQDEHVFHDVTATKTRASTSSWSFWENIWIYFNPNKKLRLNPVNVHSLMS